MKRRKLNFQSLSDVLRDLESLDSKELQILGNWTPGQIYKHLSIPIDGAIDGLNVTMPRHIRFIAQVLKPLALRMRMPAGFKLPSNAAAVLEPGPTSIEDGLSMLRNSIHRFQTNTHREPHPVLGRLTPNQWEQIMCRHCELHLSFIQTV